MDQGPVQLRKEMCLGVQLSLGSVPSLRKIDKEADYQKNAIRTLLLLKEYWYTKDSSLLITLRPKLSMKDKCDHRKGQIDANHLPVRTGIILFQSDHMHEQC